MVQSKTASPAPLRQPVRRSAFKLRRLKLLQIRMRLAPAGWGLLGLIVVEFLLSVNFSNNLIFAMTFLLVSITLIGWYHSRTNLSRMIVSDWKSVPAFVGQKAQYSLSLTSKSDAARHGLHLWANGATSSAEFHLAAGEQTECKLYRPTTQRGILATTDAALCSSFPLGIFTGRMHTGSLPTCLVYPAPSGNQPLPDNTTGHNAHLKLESGTYTDMRRYSPGDSLSRISWQAFARFDELYTKEFDGGTGQPALWIRWDDVQVTGVEEKLSQLCRWLLDAHKKHCEYGLELPSQKISPAGEESHLRECLKALALYEHPEPKAC